MKEEKDGEERSDPLLELEALCVHATISSTTPAVDWDTMDAEFRSILDSTAARLASEELSTSEAGDIFSSLLNAHLKRFNVLKPPGHPTKDRSSEVIRRSRRIEKVAEHLRVMKNTQRKMRRNNKPSFNILLRAQNKAKQMCDHIASCSELRAHERTRRE